MHLGDWGGDTLSVGVIEGEAHAEDVIANEALTTVSSKTSRILVAATMEKEGCDRLYRPIVEVLRAAEGTLRKMYYADYNRYWAGPFDALSRAVNLPPRAGISN